MEEILQKWENFGMLHGIENSELKIKLAKTYEIAANILSNKNEDNKTNNIEVTIFPAIRRMVYGVNDGEKLNSNIELSDELINNYIKYIRECVDVEKFNKHITKNIIDIEAELLTLAVSMYTRYLNTLNK
jgi:hypothetical protein